MPEFTMRVVGSTRVANNLRSAAAASKNTEAVTGRWARIMQYQLKATKYPPRRPGQRYVRTGQLANRWKAKKTGKNTWSLVNEAQQRGRLYTSYVVGDGRGKGQAWMHQNRWWIAREIVEDGIPDLRDEIVDSILDAADA